jgi:hypothetical protein
VLHLHLTYCQKLLQILGRQKCLTVLMYEPVQLPTPCVQRLPDATFGCLQGCAAWAGHHDALTLVRRTSSNVNRCSLRITLYVFFYLLRADCQDEDDFNER